jgi:hypothetical protein
VAKKTEYTPIQLLFAAILTDYSHNHGSDIFGFDISETGEVTKTGYYRHAWKGFYNVLKERVKAADLRSTTLGHIHWPFSGSTAAIRRQLAIDYIVDNAHLLGFDGAELLERVIAVIVNQYRDTGHHGYSMTSAVKVPQPYIEKLRKIKDPVARAIKPNKLNDGKASYFDPDRYALYADNGPDWLDLHYYSQGWCHEFARAINRVTGWKIIVEHNRGREDFFDQKVVHAWAYRPDGRAVDIFGLRDHEWAPNSLGLDEPWGTFERIHWWESEGPLPKYMRPVIDLVNRYPQFYGFDEPIAA